MLKLLAPKIAELNQLNNGSSYPNTQTSNLVPATNTTALPVVTNIINNNNINNYYIQQPAAAANVSTEQLASC